MALLKPSPRLIALLVGLVIVTGFTAIRVADPFPVRIMRSVTFDMFQRSAPRAYDPSVPVRIVAIDEASLKAVGQWPWPRNVLGEMVDRLHAAGAAVVAFDVMFPEPDRLSPSRIVEQPEVAAILQSPNAQKLAADLPDNDLIFADAISRGAVVLGFASATQPGAWPPLRAGFAYTGETVTGAPPQMIGATPPQETLSAGALGVGSISLGRDDGYGVVRSTPLIWGDGDRHFPSLAIEALRVAQGASTYVVHGHPTIKNAIEAVRIGGFEAPTTPGGELVMNYTHDVPDRYVSAHDLFEDDKLRALVPKLEGHIVFVGASATGLYDIRQTNLGESVPGVLIHAQAAEQILTQDFLLRADWVQALEVGTLFLTGFLLIVTTLYLGARSSFALGFVIAIGVLGGTWFAFNTSGLLIDPSFALVGGFVGWFATTAFRYVVADRDKRVIRHAFSHYVAPSILRQIENDSGRLELGGETREVSVMFSDVRDFTPLSEALSPTELVTLLNTLLGELSAQIVSEGGTIDKYIGDSVMAFWNAPLDQPDHAKLACTAALKMRAAAEKLNKEDALRLKERMGPDTEIRIGMGINTGGACVGNVGSMERFDYSAVGDAVNVASRVESSCKHVVFDILVSGATAALAEDFALLEAGGISLKGKSAPETLYLLVGDQEFRKSTPFCEFETNYKYLLRYIHAGDDAGVRTMMAKLRGHADAMHPMMHRYLDRLSERQTEFVTLKTLTDAAE